MARNDEIEPTERQRRRRKLVDRGEPVPAAAGSARGGGGVTAGRSGYRQRWGGGAGGDGEDGFQPQAGRSRATVTCTSGRVAFTSPSQVMYICITGGKFYIMP